MNIHALEHALRSFANRLGIDIHRYRPDGGATGRLARHLATHAVDVVFDVGANAGQFARSLRSAGYGGRIVSFEPLGSAHEALLYASRHDSMWDVAPRMAIGAADGVVDMNVAGNSVSSSALPMLDLHARAAPGSAFVATEQARLATFDSAATPWLRPDAVAFLKIDTQGYEDRVLDGATGALQRVSGLQLELSTVSLYEGQPLCDALVERLCRLGFAIWDISPGFFDSRTGRMLQFDAVFFREGEEALSTP